MKASLGLLLVASVVLAGCGGDDRREAVDDYLERVDRIQRPLLVGKGQLDLVLGRFSLRRTTARDLSRLDHAEDSFRSVARELDALDPPREARRLHDDLARLVELQADIVHELAWAARYTPQLRRAVEPLGPAGKRLVADLERAGDARVTAAAFASYRRALEAVLRAVEPLRAPPPLRPSLEGQRRALRRGVGLCDQIEAALARGDASGVAAAVERLAGLSADSEAAGTRRAEIAAVKAYNRRVARVSALTRAVEEARRKLDAELD